MESLPEISVVVTCFNEEKTIGECLASLMNQSYPEDRYEIVVADGNSTDKTLDVVRSFDRGMPRVAWVVEPRKGTAAGRNAGIAAARFELVAFIDADCEAPKAWLMTLATSYLELKEKNGATVGVGGANIPPEGAGRFLKAIGICLDSYLGSFNSAQGRQFKENRPVDSLATLNVLYEKGALEGVGCFDESLASEAEDADLNFKLRRAGHLLYFIGTSFVWHKMRPTPAAWLRNMFRYGKGRARLLKRHPAMWGLTFVLPLLFAAAMSSLLLIPVSRIFWGALAYFPLLFFISLGQCLRKGEPLLFIHVALVYLIQHVGYAAGEVYGLMNPAVR